MGEVQRPIFCGLIVAFCVKNFCHHCHCRHKRAIEITWKQYLVVSWLITVTFLDCRWKPPISFYTLLEKLSLWSSAKFKRHLTLWPKYSGLPNFKVIFFAGDTNISCEVHVEQECKFSGQSHFWGVWHFCRVLYPAKSDNLNLPPKLYLIWKTDRNSSVWTTNGQIPWNCRASPQPYEAIINSKPQI